MSKKNVRHANERNRLKRVVRESFRKQQGSLGSFDLVVVIKREAEKATNEAVRQCCEQVFQRVAGMRKSFASA